TLMNFGVANSSGGSNASLDFGADWVANSNTLDTNGASAGGSAPIYSTNADTGSNTTDLQGVIASIASATIATNTNDKRNNLGQSNAPAGALYGDANNSSYMGSVFVNWNGLGSSDVQLTGQQYAFTNNNGT